MQIENERFESARQKNDERLEKLKEMLVKSKASEAEQSKKLKRAEKVIELS